ncbi:NUDIX domain-containing protein [Arsenicicoccus piscis]|uniref:Nudix hydrolase domain-containing protein n=1 Tax=Arsenicicoccus piscis TaxID=673954 RepID=A0ABQ6HJ32_9MICO|nr:NUDIX domain-containing protein [Arsenicicoccus piscis]MCH8628243.1 NUDIX domain-containing protein [Arsenicicoccus piscis]GMA18493.1 hypothetical protein GCM10025862_05140 [Arsenicicoccus piscis]
MTLPPPPGLGTAPTLGGLGSPGSPGGLDGSDDSGAPDALAALHAQALALLTGWAPPDADQERLRDELVAQLRAHPDAMSRGGPPEHFTVSVLVVDAVGPALREVLLTHHAKARMWLQLGGHLEPGDADLLSAATREAREESGLADLVVRPELVELDRHALGDGFTRCREHLDLRFVAVAHGGSAQPPVVSPESLDVAWWPADALPQPCGADLPRLVERVRSLRG